MQKHESKLQWTPLQVMQDAAVIPVIVLEDIDLAVPMAEALCRGGIRMLEITLRTPAALRVIEVIAKEVEGVVVGAGTLKNAQQVEAAVRAGAKFGVSPGLTVEVCRACRDLDLALLPGVATPSEVMLAQDEGFNELKFFPAVQAGGVKMLQAFAGPFADVRFCPTGGINADNAHEFLSLENVVCVGGSWLVPQKALISKDWDALTLLAEQAVRLKV